MSTETLIETQTEISIPPPRKPPTKVGTIEPEPKIPKKKPIRKWKNK